MRLFALRVEPFDFLASRLKRRMNEKETEQRREGEAGRNERRRRRRKRRRKKTKQKKGADGEGEQKEIETSRRTSVAEDGPAARLTRLSPALLDRRPGVATPSLSLSLCLLLRAVLTNKWRVSTATANRVFVGFYWISPSFHISLGSTESVVWGRGGGLGRRIYFFSGPLIHIFSSFAIQYWRRRASSISRRRDGMGMAASEKSRRHPKPAHRRRRRLSIYNPLPRLRNRQLASEWKKFTLNHGKNPVKPGKTQ